MDILKILSGEEKSLAANLIRCLLRALSWLYLGIINLRNILYDIGLLHSSHVTAPVICIGNITAGGTGKTPMVVHITRYLQDKGLKVAVVARGYKSINTNSQSGDNDEMLLLRNLIPGAILIANSDRAKGARQAIIQGANVILMDDGFQHRKLARDLDIVLIDCTNPFGYGYILPRGLLREPVRALKRAGGIVLTRADNDSMIEFININPIAASIHKPSELINTNGQNTPLGSIAGKKVAAFCGIGNPNSFFTTLGNMKAEVFPLAFTDHAPYNTESLHQIKQLAADNDVDYIVTTEKDWVKLAPMAELAIIDTPKTPLLYTKIQLKILNGEEKLHELIDNALYS